MIIENSNSFVQKFEFDYSDDDYRINSTMGLNKIENSRCADACTDEDTSINSDELPKYTFELSRFDKCLISNWNAAMEKGMFKFGIENLPTKYIDGKYALLLQINAKRYSDKRPTEIKASSIHEPFDKNKFNFTKINKNELLLKTIKHEKNCNTLKTSTHENIGANNNLSTDMSNYIAINNCPIEFGHSLILPHMNSCSNQVISAESIELAAEISLLSNSTSILIGFNSLKGYASVNHLHFHMYYLENEYFRPERPLPIHNITNATRLTSKLWYISEEDYFFPALCLQLCDFSNAVAPFSRAIYRANNYLQQNEIPHNVVLVKCDAFHPTDQQQQERAAVTKTLKCFIFPRKPSSEAPRNDHFIGMAICELAGHFLVFDEHSFNALDEQYVINICDQVKLDKEKNQSVIRDVIKLVDEEQ